MADTPTPSAQTPSATSAAPTASAEKMPGKYKVTTLRDKCIGAASCVAISPKVFALDGEQKVLVLSQDELDDMKLLAAQSCPTQAIVITNVETGEQVWPK